MALLTIFLIQTDKYQSKESKQFVVIWKIEFRFAYEALRSGAQDSACLVIVICKKVCDSCRFSLITCGASLWGLP